MSSHTTVNVTEIADTARRVVRTTLQVGIPSFLALAGALPIVLQVAASINLSPTVRAALIATAAAITGAAALLTRFMAVPAVNTALDTLNLGGQSVLSGANDTETRMLNLPVLQAANGAGN